jgi:hypothetical protein
VEEQFKHWKMNKHDIVIFDHCSTDSTRNLIELHRQDCVGIHYVPSSVPFANNGIFEHVSKILISDYSKKYDWITFIESDEFYEGPDRTKNYYEHLLDVHQSNYDYIHFDSYNFACTKADDPLINNFRERLRYYAYKFDYLRVYAWRAHLTNIRRFNANPPAGGHRYPVPFKSCHYEIRSLDQIIKKLADRAKSIKGNKGHNHTKEMLKIPPTQLLDLIDYKQLHYDDGKKELILATGYDWRGLRRKYTPASAKTAPRRHNRRR